MKNILLAAASERNLDILASMVSVIAEANIMRALEGKDVRHILNNNDVDLIVINTPLADEQGLELSLFAADNVMAPVIVITSEETFLRSGEKLESQGVVVITRPVDKKVFMRAVNDLIIAGRFIRILLERNKRLESAIEEGKLVNRAKAALMNNLNMTEAQAHRYIEKQAMDLRKTKGAISQGILKTYYNR